MNNNIFIEEIEVGSGLKHILEWHNHCCSIDPYFFIRVGWDEKKTLDEIHAHKLLVDADFSRTIRVVDTRWSWWRLYLIYNFLAFYMSKLRMKIYILLWKSGMLITQEGAYPTWRDIRLFGTKQKQ